MIVVVGLTCAVGAIVVGVVVHKTEVARALPPATASSTQVLKVYLRAAKSGDCGLTEALTAAADDPSMAWCGGGFRTIVDNHPELISYTNIGAVIRDEAGSGAAEECIPVDIVEDHMTGAEPGAMPEWQFCFEKTPAGWRLADEGYG